jgi:hypothetical protein
MFSFCTCARSMNILVGIDANNIIYYDVIYVAIIRYEMYAENMVIHVVGFCCSCLRIKFIIQITMLNFKFLCLIVFALTSSL